MSSAAYLIFGDDEYVVSTKAEQIVKTHVPPENAALGLETIDGHAEIIEAAVQAADLCLSAILTPGLFSGFKVVWFRTVNFLSNTVVGKSDQVKPKLNRLAECIHQGIPEGITLVVSAAGVDKHSAFYKAFKTNGQVCECSLPNKTKQVAESFGMLAEERNLRMSREVRETFLERVGPHTRLIISELDKLSLFMGNRKPVQLEDVWAVVSSSRESPVWDLADAFGTRNLPRALELVRQLLFQKESAIRLAITLESRIRDLLLYKEALQRGWMVKERNFPAWSAVPAEVEQVFSEELDRDPRTTHPYRAGLLANQAAKFSREELRICQRLILSAHEKLVSSGVSETMILESTLIAMLS